MQFADTLRGSVLAKIAVIGALTLIMLIPIARVESLIQERASRQSEAVAEISSKWGGSQSVVGPILVAPYRSTWRDENGKTQERIEHAVFLPESLRVDGDLAAERRARGMFETVLYAVDAKLHAEFEPLDFAAIGVNPANVQLDRAVLLFGISDAIGIRTIETRWNNRALVMNPGASEGGLFSSGVHARDLRLTGGGRYVLEADIKLQGSSQLSFAPLGKTTLVRLSSPWKDPSFNGAFLPSEREVSADGFTAQWNVSYFQRNAPQSWAGAQETYANALFNSAFGVSLFLPADSYQQSERAVKYSLLFIGLTFLAFFLFEVFFKLGIHPFQYLLVGAGIVIFYVLLLAISEHAGFFAAYVCAALATTALITAYCMKTLQNKKRAGVMAGLLSGLYVYLFATLASEDLSLLLGAIVLFTGLALVMFLTRNIDWYTLRLARDDADRSNV